MRFSVFPHCRMMKNAYLCWRNTKSEKKMKQVLVLTVSSLLVLSSCGTYTGTGAYVGGQFGTILGSAVGGISGGHRGSDIGSIVGMAGGAIIGAAVGSAADRQQAEQVAARQQARQQRVAQQRADAYQQDDASGFDAQGGGDDRIDFDGAGPVGSQQRGYSAAQARTINPSQVQVASGYSVNVNEQIHIRNARFVDADQNGVLQAGEQCKVTFEIMNRSAETIYDVQPMVFDVTKNKHIHISPNLHIESIAPNSGARYTATIVADRKLRDGQVVIRVGVAQGDREITSQVKEFTITTRRK